MRKLVVVVSIVLICGMTVDLSRVVLGQGTEEARFEYVAEYNGWHTARFIDNFDDTPTSWLTYIEHGEGSHIRLVCWNDNEPGFFAMVNGKDLVGPFQTKIRIDSNAVIEVDAPVGYNAFLLTEQSIYRTVMEQMRSGKEVRFRITTVEGTNTFRLSLLGFKQASDWVLKECNVMLGEQTEKQNE